MARNTKDRIVSVSINLFNELGQSNVRLQQIADEAGISVGNLAYHFKNKEAIINRVYEDLFSDFSQLLSFYLRSSELNDFDLHLGRYFQFFQKYRFHLADLMASQHETVQTLANWNNYANKLHAQIRLRIDFYVSNDQMIAEPASGLYDQLSKNVWRSIFFSIPESIFRGQPLNEQAFRKEVWTQFIPYFTKQGQAQFSNSVALD